jgi:hypothetical protein
MVWRLEPKVGWIDTCPEKKSNNEDTYQAPSSNENMPFYIVTLIIQPLPFPPTCCPIILYIEYRPSTITKTSFPSLLMPHFHPSVSTSLTQLSVLIFLLKLPNRFFKPSPTRLPVELLLFTLLSSSSCLNALAIALGGALPLEPLALRWRESCGLLLVCISYAELPSDMTRRWALFSCSLRAFSMENEGSPLPL